MAIPAALIPLGAALKGLLGAGTVKAGAAGAGAFAKGAAARRMAGEALGKTGSFLLKNAGANKGEVAMRLGPDLFFGGVQGVMTPGDLGDKLIAGTTTAVGGAVGGIGAGGLARKFGADGMTQTMADLAGSYGGDFAGMAVGDGIMRGKDKLFGGEGLTPYERQGKEYEEAMRQQMEQEILAKYGMDPFMATNGLA